MKPALGSVLPPFPRFRPVLSSLAINCRLPTHSPMLPLAAPALRKKASKLHARFLQQQQQQWQLRQRRRRRRSQRRGGARRGPTYVLDRGEGGRDWFRHIRLLRFPSLRCVRCRRGRAASQPPCRQTDRLWEPLSTRTQRTHTRSAQERKADLNVFFPIWHFPVSSRETLKRVILCVPSVFFLASLR